MKKCMKYCLMRMKISQSAQTFSFYPLKEHSKNKYEESDVNHSLKTIQNIQILFQSLLFHEFPESNVIFLDIAWYNI